jgi:superfamily I DNA/RNA helicase
MLLNRINPTPEQRKIFFINPDQAVLISGRAGSGKTSVAILRAAQLMKFFIYQGLKNPRVGFFVFNKALKTYINSLASIELNRDQYDVWTIDAWCLDFLNSNSLLSESIANDAFCRSCIRNALNSLNESAKKSGILNLGEEFLTEEINYLLGRFGLDTDKYIQSQREGRGLNPSLTPHMKQVITTEIVPAYQLALGKLNMIDWNQIRDRTLSYMSTGVPFTKYDIIIIDEVQDLNVVQLKVAKKITSEITGSITFIGDTTQRIYKSNYVWRDVDCNFNDGNRLNLTKNYRNTKEIASMAASLMEKENEILDFDIINPALTNSSGALPVWFRGRYNEQIKYLITALERIDTDKETVCVLHIKSDNVDELYLTLTSKFYECSMLRDDDLEHKSKGIYLSTLHSSKGLEFTHVFVIGFEDWLSPGPLSLSHRNTSAHISSHRRLLYTAITRAQKTFTILSSLNQYSRFIKDIDLNLLEIRGS